MWANWSTGLVNALKKVHLNSLLKVVQDHVRRLTELLGQEKEPPLILNKHCVECEFRARCREKASGDGRFEPPFQNEP